MLLNREKSGLLLIDIQEKLTPHVLNHQALIERCQWLIRLAHDVSVPIVLSEQYPNGLGKTVAPLSELMPSLTAIHKVHFSCYRDQGFIGGWRKMNKLQVVIAGIETHVCVLQTAIDMKNEGIEVFVVVDAVSCRQELCHTTALKRMAEAGIQLVTSEMVFFEWVEQAGTPIFKTLSQSYLR